jgi:hypothetical protein
VEFLRSDKLLDFGFKRKYVTGWKEGFTKLTTEMLEYCDQDVELTYQLFIYLLGESFFPY